jgi:2-polyprenyl-6-methoxyphenol hydroxylase-like FAD-dependent oxidoreductase
MNRLSVRGETKAYCDVLIQGAGIAELTLAIALQQRGYKVKLVERSPGLAEVGAGIWMAGGSLYRVESVHLPPATNEERI